MSSHHPPWWMICFARMAGEDSHAIWISRLGADALRAYARSLEGKDIASLPLYGIPFAIKDNIDLAGLPTTAGCPEYAYAPEKHATVVQRLIDAGAIPLGKTNLDQFATGLNGTRSLTVPAATPSTPTSFPAAPVPARPSPWRSPGKLLRSELIPPDPAACPPRSTTWSATSRAAARCPPVAWCPPAARSTPCRSSPSPPKTPSACWPLPLVLMLKMNTRVHWRPMV